MFNPIKSAAVNSNYYYYLLYNIHIQHDIQLIQFKNRDSRGFAFVTYENTEDAKEAIQATHKTNIDGR